MLRNKHGVNFDEGIPFTEVIEFEKLYVQCHPDYFSELLDWLKAGNDAILVGGQIGSGKSTFINKAFRDSTIHPDIILNFDSDRLDKSSSAFLRILFVEIVKKALASDIDLSFSNLPSDLTDGAIIKWDNLIDVLNNEDYSLNTFTLRTQITNKLEVVSEFILITLSKILSIYIDRIKRNVLIYASGIDKYEQYSTDFFSLNLIIPFLGGYKTLFEVNAVHLFNNTWELKNKHKIFLTALNDDQTRDLLVRRMGIYSNSISDTIENMILYSGGNPRQSLRLLINFMNFNKNNLNHDLSLKYSIKKTLQDYFAFAIEPTSELMNYIIKEEVLSSNIFTLPGDKDTAQRALYGNWIFIKESMEGNKWKVGINPIVKLLFPINTDVTEFEKQLIKIYADDNQMSQTGLTIPSDSKTIQSQIQQSIQENYVFNLTEILGIISTALLSKDRQDRIIIAYKDENILAASRHYIFAKANTFEFQTFKHFDINNIDISISDQIVDAIKMNKVDIYSFDLKADYNEVQIEDIDKIRDFFLPYQMIWWIPINKLKIYLPHWTQLRQLFEVFILDDELLASLNEEEIEEDIKNYSHSNKSKKTKETEMNENLKIVLDLLRIAKREQNG